MFTSLLSFNEPLIWTNQPAAITWLGSVTNSRPTILMDLTNAAEFRVCLIVNGSTGSVNSKIVARYRTSYSGTATDYSVLGSSSTEVYCGMTASGTRILGAWTTITSAARTMVEVGCFGLDGDGVADPNIGQILFQYR